MVISSRSGGTCRQIRARCVVFDDFFLGVLLMGDGLGVFVVDAERVGRHLPAD